MNGETSPSVCIVVPNYNGRNLLERFLPALAATDYEPLELVVVDNASKDDSVNWLRLRWPQVTVLEQSRNLFWAGGNNVGILYAKQRGHRFILFANNDIEPHPFWVREAVKFSMTHSEYGMVGFRLFNRDSERQAFETAGRELSEVKWHEVADVTGCYLFCPMELFEAVGVFDERYELYRDEADFERRAFEAGWRAAELNVPVWHLNEATAMHLGLRLSYLQMRNDVRFHLKLGGIRAGLRAMRSLLILTCNPRISLKSGHVFWMRRYQPANWIVNAVIALSAIMWNLAHLMETRRVGNADRQRIARRCSNQESRHC